MATKTRDRIFALLDAIKADFPRRKKAAEALIRRMGLNKTLEMEIEAPAPVLKLTPTFDPKISHETSPMLKARLEYAGSWKRGQDVWLSAGQMASVMKKKDIQPFHLSLRENWDGSAPAIFTDDRLTLFGITESVPENLVYLVWAADEKEPEVWSYAGFDARKFKDLEQYLKWCLERE